MKAIANGERLVIDGDFGIDPLAGRALHEVLGRARSAAGLAEAKLHGRPAFLVTRYDDLRAFLLDQEKFPAGVTYEFQTKPVVGNTFINMDGDEHNRYRQLAMPAFRSRTVTRFVQSDLRPLAHEVVDRFVAKGEGDLVAELTALLPFWSISRKLGLPIGSEEEQRRLARTMLTYPHDPKAACAAAFEVTRFLEPIVDERRRNPGDDVLSHLLTAEFRGLQFTDEEVFSHVRLLYSVGATTTSDAMSNLFYRLLGEPGLLERAIEQPECRPSIVQELLRCEPPVAVLPRAVLTGGCIGDTELPPGSIVLAALAAANRDPEVFADAEHFDIDRGEEEILTFGVGSKFCPGAYLARGQLLTALDVVLERLHGLRLVDAAEPTGSVLRSVPRIQASWTSG